MHKNFIHSIIQAIDQVKLNCPKELTNYIILETNCKNGNDLYSQIEDSEQYKQ